MSVGSRLGIVFMRAMAHVPLPMARKFGTVLGHVLSHDSIWQATGADIARWFCEHHHDGMLAQAMQRGEGAT